MTNRLFMTDGEIAKELGFSAENFKAKADVLERSGFPKRDPMFDNRRYWPAVKDFLDRWHNIGSQSPMGNNARDGVEKWNRKHPA